MSNFETKLRFHIISSTIIKIHASITELILYQNEFSGFQFNSTPNSRHMTFFVFTLNTMKILIIRFSSIGDLTRALSIPARLVEHYGKDNVQIHFLTREDFSQLLKNNPSIHQVWTLNRKKGLTEIFKIAKELNKENYDLIYDAHNNLRSFIFRCLVASKKNIVKPMDRWKRFLLINFKINKFQKPFSGQRDLLKPLEKIGIPFLLPKPPQLFFDAQTIQKIETLLNEKKINKNEYFVFVPSAAYPLKRWPIAHWQKLISMSSNTPVVVLAGPTDQFTQVLNSFTNIINLTGQTNLIESAAIIHFAKAVVANDTGLLHFSEQLGKPTIALMGPAPFGFPSRQTTCILEIELKCRPCSKHGQGPCTNTQFQKCMIDITPEQVHQNLMEIST